MERGEEDGDLQVNGIDRHRLPRVIIIASRLNPNFRDPPSDAFPYTVQSQLPLVLLLHHHPSVATRLPLRQSGFCRQTMPFVALSGALAGACRLFRLRQVRPYRG